MASLLHAAQRFLFLQAFLLTGVLTLSAQVPSSLSVQKAIDEKNAGLAQEKNDEFINYYTGKRQADSLVTAILYAGKIAILTQENSSGTKRVKSLLQQIKTFSSAASIIRAAYIEAGDYYNSSGQYELAYEANNEAFQYGLKVAGIRNSQLAISQNNMFTNLQRMGKRAEAKQHTLQALYYLSKDPKPDFEVMYNSYNGLGIFMWYASMLDSAAFYYNKALEALRKADTTAINKYYRPAIIYNNLSSIYSVQGKPSECIKVLQLCINSYKQFLASGQSGSKKLSAMTFQLEATDNLGSIYNELGNFRQAHDLLFYSYQQKKKILSEDNPGLFISEILLGRIYYSLKEFDKASQYLDKGLARLHTSVGTQPVWESDAYYTLAMLNDEKQQRSQAALYYEKADSLFAISREGSYDNIYLEFLRSAALFYARHQMNEQAAVKARKAYDYVRKTEGVSSLLFFYQLLNLSEVSYEAGDYKKSLAYSDEALQSVTRIAAQSASLADSIMVELKKPRAVLLRSKSRYALGPKNEVLLRSILDELKEALAVVERRKSILRDAKDISLLMAEQADLFAFIKVVLLDIYSLSKSDKIPFELLSIHESSLYSKLRARLDQSDFSDERLPEALQRKEVALKNELTTALQSKGPHDQVLQRYLTLQEDWNKLLNTLRTNHPRYYNLRYASILKPVHEVQAAIPAGTTVIRYFFVGKRLFAFVADQQQQHFVELPVTTLETDIKELLRSSSNAAITTPVFYKLYKELWAPLAQHVRYSRVSIIPDGILYQLNFEVLTPVKVNSYEQFATNSLLAKYSISYGYSLFLSHQPAGGRLLKQNYVAFAPGFSDDVKEAYKRSHDSIDYDYGYLSLLPQPFAISLAQRSEDLFGGNAFLHAQSTVPSFTSNAGGHKIIYIGTHAEANNEHPEYSKLIFAKSDGAENNFMYLPDIYNCDLRSHLAILTACETGMPGYQDGEGMISMAHAFNYAGSESMVTALWKIDEKASALITEYFYSNILKGMHKDEALRQAKLQYLSTAEGRALSPQYWSGLVLIGDTDPVSIPRRMQPWWFVVIGVIVVGAGGFLLYRRRQTRRSAAVK